ncbi:MAG: energy transducer TonB [Treponema sp.]|nr:energy transducer TonB [Treponema sp.]
MPLAARRAGIQGVTEASFIIHEDGSGCAVLDEAALAAIFAAAPTR